MATKRTTTTVEEEPAEGDEPTGIAVERTPEPTPAPTPSNGDSNQHRVFTQEEVEAMMEKARQQEKDKLYPRLSEQEEVLKRLQEDLEARQAAQAEADRRAEEERQAREREELSAKDLLTQTESRFQQQLAEMQGRIESQQALWQREQEFQQLTGLRQQLLNEAFAEDPLAIADEFLDYVRGSTEDEIRQSVAMARAKTASIVAQVRGAQQQQRQQQKGTSVTQPPVGPMETDQAFEMMSPDDIASLSMEEYAKRRPQLMAAISRSRTGAR